MPKGTLPKSIRVFIRRQKARIRKQTSDSAARAARIDEFLKAFRASSRSSS